MARYDSGDAIIENDCHYGGVKLDENKLSKESYQNLNSLLQEMGFEDNCFLVNHIGEINVGNVMRVKRWSTYSKAFYIIKSIKYSSRIGELKCYKIQLVPFQNRKDCLQLTYTMVENRNPPGGFVDGDGSIYDIQKDKAVILSDRVLAEVFELENEEAFIADII